MTTKNKILIVAGTLLALLPAVALAADNPLDAQISSLFSTLDVILLFLQAFLWPILLMIGSLLGNDLIFSGGMQTMLLNIWSAIRDFVNIMFVLGLLFVAIYNIVGGKDEAKYGAKAALPKIVIALIAVNFSFFACKVILDVVNVTSTAIFAIPIASTELKKYENPDEQAKLTDTVCGRLLKLTQSKTVAAISKNPFCDPPPAGSPAGTKAKLKDAGIKFFSTFNSRNAALVMAIELMDITNLDNVKPNGAVSSLKELTINTLFSIVFFIIYATAYIALFVSLLIRVVVLWIAIAVSPLSALAFAFEGLKAKFGEDEPFKLFLDHALIPLFVAPILTIGMIMITQLKQISPGGFVSTNPKDFGSLTTGMTVLQDIIAGMATAAFIWMAAFKALESGKAKGFVGSIKNTVQGFATNVAKLPLYAPILPVYKADGTRTEVGLAALGSVMNGPKNFIEKQQRVINDTFGSNNDKLTSQGQQVKNKDQAKTFIADALTQSNNQPDKDLRKLMGEKFEKFDREMNLKIPPTVFGGDRKKFIEALKSGEEIDRTTFEAFLAANPDLKPSAVQTGQQEKSVKEARKAATGDEKGKKVDTAKEPDVAALNTALGDLDKAEEDLKAAKGGKGNLNDAKEAVDKAAHKVKEIAAARDKVKQLTLTPGDVKDGQFVKPAAFDGARKVYEEAKGANITDEEIKKMLTQRFKAPPYSLGDKAEALAETVIKNKTMPAAPASPTGEPPKPPAVTP